MHPLMSIAENAARSAGRIIARAVDRMDRVRLLRNHLTILSPMWMSKLKVKSLV